MEVPTWHDTLIMQAPKWNSYTYHWCTLMKCQTGPFFFFIFSQQKQWLCCVINLKKGCETSAYWLKHLIFVWHLETLFNPYSHGQLVSGTTNLKWNGLGQFWFFCHRSKYFNYVLQKCACISFAASWEPKIICKVNGKIMVIHLIKMVTEFIYLTRFIPDVKNGSFSVNSKKFRVISPWKVLAQSVN